MSAEDRDACPVAAEVTADDDLLPYVVLFAGVLHEGATAIADRAAEYRAIFHGIPEGRRVAFGVAFRAYVEGPMT